MLTRVDPAGIGVIGSSRGGTVALAVSAFELRFAVTLGCFTDGVDWPRGPWCDRLRGATLVAIDDGPHELRLGAPRTEVLDLVEEWIAQR